MHGCRSCDYDVCEACLKRRESCAREYHYRETWLPIAGGRSWVELHTPTSTVARTPVENDLINGSWNVDDAFALIDASDHDRHLPLTHAKLPHDNLLARVICAPEMLVQHSSSCLLSSATGAQNGDDAEVCGQCLDAFDQHEEWLGDATLPAYSRDQDCPGKHGLVSFSAPKSWRCGICDRNVSKGSVMHDCDSCDYDVCDACFKPRASGSEDEQPAWEVMRSQLAVTAEFRRTSLAYDLGLSQTRSPSSRCVGGWSSDVPRGILPRPYFAHYTPQTGQLLDNAIIGHAASEFVRDGELWVAKSHLAICAIDEDVCEIGIQIPSAAHIAECGMVERKSANVQRSLASNEPPKVLFLSDCGFRDSGFLPSRKKCGCSQFDEDIRGGLIGFVRLCKRLVGGSSLANCKAMSNSLGVRNHVLERNYRLLKEGKITEEEDPYQYHQIPVSHSDFLRHAFHLPIERRLHELHFEYNRDFLPLHEHAALGDVAFDQLTVPGAPLANVVHAIADVQEVLRRLVNNPPPPPQLADHGPMAPPSWNGNSWSR